MLKNSELFPTNLALYISLSLILVFNLKSARNRWVAPFLSLHKVPALSSFPSRRIPLFLSYFPPIHLHQRTFTRHQVGWQRSRVHKFPQLDPKIIFFGVRLSCFPIRNSILPDNACNPLSFGLVPRNFTRNAHTSQRVQINEAFKTCVVKFVLSNMKSICRYFAFFLSGNYFIYLVAFKHARLNSFF